MSRPTILQDIDYLKDGQLVGKYFTPTSVLETREGTTQITTNPLPIAWSLPTGAGETISYYTSGSYKIEASQNSANKYTGLRYAFDGIDTTAFLTETSAPEIFVIVSLPSAINVSKIKYHIECETLTGVYFEGSTTGSNGTWTTLLSDTSGPTIELTEKTLTSTGNYQYYRLRLTKPSSMVEVYLYELMISSYSIPVQINKLTLEGIPTPLDVNQRIMIKTPDFSNTATASPSYSRRKIWHPDNSCLPQYKTPYWFSYSSNGSRYTVLKHFS